MSYSPGFFLEEPPEIRWMSQELERRGGSAASRRGFGEEWRRRRGRGLNPAETLPGRKMRWIWDLGAANIQLSLSRVFTSLSSAAMRSAFRSAPRRSGYSQSKQWRKGTRIGGESPGEGRSVTHRRGPRLCGPRERRSLGGRGRWRKRRRRLKIRRHRRRPRLRPAPEILPASSSSSRLPTERAAPHYLCRLSKPLEPSQCGPRRPRPRPRPSRDIRRIRPSNYPSGDKGKKKHHQRWKLNKKTLKF